MSGTDWDALARRDSYTVFNPILVRIRDLDLQAHVNNSVVAAYLEEGRYRLLNFGIRRSLPDDAIGGFVVAEQVIRYLREIRETGELAVGTRVERIGNSSFAMGQGIFQGDACMATALLTMVHIDRATRKGAPLSPAFRASLEAHTCAAHDAAADHFRRCGSPMAVAYINGAVPRGAPGERMKSMFRMVLVVLAVVSAMPAAMADQPPAPEIQRFAELILYRLDLGEHVAAWKWRNNKPIEDPTQEQKVLDAAAVQAEAAGLDFATVRPFLAAQMEASKATQRRWFAVWKAHGLPATQPDLDLTTVLRPSIARAGDAILAQLVLVRPLLDVPDQRDHLLSILTTAAKQRGLAPEALTEIARQAGKVAYAPQGASLLDRIQARKQLRVGTPGDYAPFSIKGPDGYTGIDVDLARNLADSLGVELVFVPTTWPTLMQDLKGNMFDIAMGGITKTQERQREAYQSRAYLTDGKLPIVRCGEEQKYDTLDEINRKGVRVIVNPGGTNERFVQAKITDATVQVFPDNTRIFDEIAAGRADVMITDKAEVQWQAAHNPKLCAATGTTFNLTEKAYIMPRDDALLRYVDSWLDRIEADGTLKATFDKYLKKPQ